MESDKELLKLKAQAYDHIAQIDMLRQQLAEINQKIAELQVKQTSDAPVSGSG